MVLELGITNVRFTDNLTGLRRQLGHMPKRGLYHGLMAYAQEEASLKLFDSSIGRWRNDLSKGQRRTRGLSYIISS